MQMRVIPIKIHRKHFLDEICLFRLRLHWETGSEALTYGRSEGLRVV